MAGDLNLKKAWHPLTRNNLEKVYLAEKEAEEELKRIEAIKEQKRQDQEKKYLRDLREKAGLSLPKPERLDWMYQGTDSSQDSNLREASLASLEKIPIKRGEPSKKFSTQTKELKLRKCDEWSKSKEDPMLK